MMLLILKASKLPSFRLSNSCGNRCIACKACKRIPLPSSCISMGHSIGMEEKNEIKSRRMGYNKRKSGSLIDLLPSLLLILLGVIFLLRLSFFFIGLSVLGNKPFKNPDTFCRNSSSKEVMQLFMLLFF